jgi:hypothetical protein
MGYVHQENQGVRGVLVRLGFAPTGQTIRLGPDEARGFLRRDAAGVAVADVLTIPPLALHALADWVESFGGTIAGRGGRVEIALSDDLFRNGPVGVAAAVRRAANAQRVG